MGTNQSLGQASYNQQKASLNPTVAKAYISKMLAKKYPNTIAASKKKVAENAKRLGKSSKMLDKKQ